jgi:hypothetical protein
VRTGLCTKGGLLRLAEVTVNPRMKTDLGQRFWNSSEPQESCENRLLGLILRFCFSRSGQGLRICISGKFQVTLMLLTGEHTLKTTEYSGKQRPSFELFCSKHLKYLFMWEFFFFSWSFWVWTQGLSLLGRSCINWATPPAYRSFLDIS